MKVCSVCKESKPLSEFYNYAKSEDGKYHRCKECDEDKRREFKRNNRDKAILRSRKNNLKYIYNLTLDDYDRMLEIQGGGCAICGTTVPGKGKNHKKSFCVDHDHESGEIRGLLCNSCNRAIGLMYDNLEIVKSAVTYLEKSSKEK